MAHEARSIEADRSAALLRSKDNAGADAVSQYGGGLAAEGLKHLASMAQVGAGPINGLTTQARNQPNVQRVSQLQHIADRRSEQKSAADEFTGRPMMALAMRGTQRISTGSGGGQTQRSSLRATTQLHRAAPSRGNVQYPALIGACNTPLSSPLADQSGAVVTQMARADYARWQGTLQAKSAPHGVIHQDGLSTVARWRHSEPVAQRITKLTQKMKAGLVMAEAALTIIAGVAGLVAGAGFGAIPLVVPSILAVITGVLKFGRGYLMYQTNPPEGKKLAAIDAIRTIEAGIALAGALLADPTSFYKIPALIFSIAKSVRSLATALADFLDTKAKQKNKKPGVFVKGLKAISAAAHTIEAITAGFSAGASLGEGIATLATGGDAALGTAKTVAGATGLGIATAKAARAADQGVALVPLPQNQQQGGADAQAGPAGPNLGPGPADLETQGSLPAPQNPVPDTQEDSISVASDVSESGYLADTESSVDSEDEYEDSISLSSMSSVDESGYDADTESLAG